MYEIARFKNPKTNAKSTYNCISANIVGVKC